VSGNLCRKCWTLNLVLIFFGVMICELGESCEESCEAIVPRLGDGLTRFVCKGLMIYGSGFLSVVGDCGRSHHGVCMAGCVATVACDGVRRHGGEGAFECQKPSVRGG
jgi:hypothetical protein